MKALILAGGKGTRLRPISWAIPKQLVPVANRPLIFHILELIAMAGINDVGLVVSPGNHQEIQEACSSMPGDIKINYIIQEKPGGIAHAVKMARGFLGNSAFLLYLGDNLIEAKINTMVEDFKSSKVDAMIFLKKVPNPSAFGVAVTDEAGRILRLIEKPKDPPTDLAVTGIYLFRPAIHEAIDKISPSWRGELEITDAIQKMIDTNCSVEARLLQGWWLDTGKKSDILQSNKLVLEKDLGFMVEGLVDEKSILSGKIEIKKGSVVEASIINGPVIIGPGCLIKNSFIGPYVSIGQKTDLYNTQLNNSVLMEGCEIKDVSLTDCLIGSNTKIANTGINNVISSLIVGNDCEILFINSKGKKREA